MSTSRSRTPQRIAARLAVGLFSCMIIAAFYGCGDQPQAGSISLEPNKEANLKPVTFATKGAARPPQRAARP